jgi:hypothetical protein
LLAQNKVAPLWKKVGPYQVRVDSSLGNGCFFSAAYGPEKALRIGINGTTKHTYVDVFSTAWKSLQVNKRYPIVVQGGWGPKTWDGRGVNFNDRTFALVFDGLGPELWNQLAQTAALSFSYQGTLIATMNLPNVNDAIAAVAECQNYFMTQVPAVDPLAKLPAQTTVDPFENKQ